MALSSSRAAASAWRGYTCFPYRRDDIPYLRPASLSSANSSRCPYRAGKTPEGMTILVTPRLRGRLSGRIKERALPLRGSSIPLSDLLQGAERLRSPPLEQV